MYTINQLNQVSNEKFISILHGIFEHSPWVAEKAVNQKPYTSLQHLHQTMVETVKNSPYTDKITLIRAHPNLGERISMTNHSTKEQKGAGLQNLTPEEYEQFTSTNHQYMKKFGFPFILAVRGKNKHEIYEAMKARIHSSEEAEFETALSEIYKIALLRLEEMIIREDDIM